MLKDKLLYLESKGYSVTPLTEHKVPILLNWVNVHLNSNEIKSILSSPVVSITNNKGQTYQKEYAMWGLVCGVNDVEVIDIDLKVFSSLKERTDWWNEFISFCEDNIEDFLNKVVIQKTKNNGYHIIYKTESKVGNTKIAKLKDHKEAIIETRGVGGQIVMYGNFLTEKTYSDIKYLTQEDRDILWSICKTYNFIEEVESHKYNNQVRDFNNNSLTPWEDFNNKTNIYDIVGEDFKQVRQLKDKTIIKRHGASSPHSGYIYHNSGCMFLFSTGTIYPNETLITPFIAYTHKYHNGDFKASASDLYQQGFGARSGEKIQQLAQKVVDNIEPLKINEEDLIFPIDIFPAPIQSYITDCNVTLNNSIDYMGCSLLWVISTCIGNSMEVEVKRGWKENATIWLSLVGKAGIGKTPSINSMVFPLERINNRMIKDFQKEHEKFDHYNTLSPQDKKDIEEVKRPKKNQMLVNDITLEALIELHQERDNGVSVFKDELAGWLKDMNKYRDGSDLEFWLSSWSGKTVSVNRVQRGVSIVNKPFIPVLGGIQPSILSNLSTEENQENGFLDRMLLSYPELIVDRYNDKELNGDAYQYYDDAITLFYQVINETKDIIKRNEHGNIVPITYTFSPEAKKEWIKYFNEITDIQNSDDESEFFKSMLPKQKSYVPRFALLIHVFNGFISDESTNTLISKESVLKAIKLSKYFINMAKKIKINSTEVITVKSILNTHKNKSKKEIVFELYKANKDFNKNETASLMTISRKTIYNWIKEFESQKKQ